MIEFNDELEKIVDEFLPITSLDLGCSRRMEAKNKQREKAKQLIGALIQRTIDATLNAVLLFPPDTGINLNTDGQ